jgi:uncharacterized membrane protein (UPF0127 family)
MRVIDDRNDNLLADDAQIAESLIAKLVGLIGKRSLPAGKALIIPDCRQVHTFFMRFSTDVLFYDAQRLVVGMESGVRPYCVTGYYRHATGVVELPVGTLLSCGIAPGDLLRFEKAGEEARERGNCD